jgi:hypothetical protein
VLRRVKDGPAEPAPLPRYVGVDDWAVRKGLRYGTILNDPERGRVIDLLPGRDLKQLTKPNPFVHSIRPFVPSNLALRRQRASLLGQRAAALARVGRTLEAVTAVQQAIDEITGLARGGGGMRFPPASPPASLWSYCAEECFRQEPSYLYDLACYLALASTLPADAKRADPAGNNPKDPNRIQVAEKALQEALPGYEAAFGSGWAQALRELLAKTTTWDDALPALLEPVAQRAIRPIVQALAQRGIQLQRADDASGPWAPQGRVKAPRPNTSPA